MVLAKGPQFSENWSSGPGAVVNKPTTVGNTFDPFANAGYQTPPAPAPATPVSGGFVPTPAVNAGFNPSTAGSTASSPATNPVAPVHHFTNQDADVDSTFQSQAAAYKSQLASYLQGVYGQVGKGNVTATTDSNVDPFNIQTNYKLRDLGPLYSFSNQNGQNHFVNSHALDGGSMGTDFNSALTGLDQSRTQGLTNLGEDYAARGLGFSGVYQQQKQLNDNGYQQQATNLGNSVNNQLNSLNNTLTSTQTGLNNQINSARTDALQRLTNQQAMGLPTLNSSGGN
jgi:hypothetical protein